MLAISVVASSLRRTVAGPGPKDGTGQRGARKTIGAAAKATGTTAVGRSYRSGITKETGTTDTFRIIVNF
jgi:hypothetical protein